MSDTISDQDKSKILESAAREAAFVRSLEDYAFEHSLDIRTDSIYLYSKAKRDAFKEVVTKLFER